MARDKYFTIMTNVPPSPESAPLFVGGPKGETRSAKDCIEGALSPRRGPLVLICTEGARRAELLAGIRRAFPEKDSLITLGSPSLSPISPYVDFLAKSFAGLAPPELSATFSRLGVYPPLRPLLTRLLGGEAAQDAEFPPEEMGYLRSRFFEAIEGLMREAEGEGKRRFLIEGGDSMGSTGLDFLRFLADKKGSPSLILILGDSSELVGRGGITGSRWAEFELEMAGLDRIVQFGIRTAEAEAPVPRGRRPGLSDIRECRDLLCWPELEEACSSLLEEEDRGEESLRPEEKLEVIMAQCLARRHLGKSDQLLISSSRFLGEARTTQDPVWLSKALRTASDAFLLHDRAMQARKAAAEAFRIARESGVKDEIVKSGMAFLVANSTTARIFGDASELESAFETSVKMAGRLHRENDLAFMLSNPIYLMHLLRTGKGKLALANSRRALALARRLGNEFRLSKALHAQALLVQTLGDRPGAALAAYRRSAGIADRIGDRLMRARIRNGLGYFQFASGNFRGAAVSYLEALSLLEGSAAFEELCMTLVNLGFVSLFSFRYEDAAKYLDLALRLMNRLGLEDLSYNPRTFVVALLGIARARGGSGEAAAEYLNLIANSRGPAGRSRRVEYPLLLRALVAEARNERTSSLSDFETLIDHLEQIPRETSHIRLFALLEYGRAASKLDPARLPSILSRGRAILDADYGAKEMGAYRAAFARGDLGALSALPIPIRHPEPAPLLAAAERQKEIESMHDTIVEVHLLNELQTILGSRRDTDSKLVESARLIAMSLLLDACAIEIPGASGKPVILEEPARATGTEELRAALPSLARDGGDRPSPPRELRLAAGADPRRPSLWYVSLPLGGRAGSDGHLICFGASPADFGRAKMRSLSIAARQIGGALELQRVHALLVASATTDQLTGLHNRMRIRELVDAELRRFLRAPEPEGARFCLLYLDLDGFKAYNDRHGHRTGDFVLKLFASVLREATRDIDQIGRLGGDEFLVLTIGCASKGAEEIAARIIESFEESRKEIAAFIGEEALLPGSLTPISCSIGIAEARLGDGLDPLIDRADAALYRAKGGGKGRFILAE